MAKAKPNYKEFVEGQLECSVCLETVKDPKTLQGCFHSFCSTCLDRLLAKEGGPEPGVTCPVCRKFSRREDIQANFFIKNLADMHLAHTERRSCEQCPEEIADASSKCLDCKMLLCDSCKAAHLKIKLLQSHRILPLSEDTELIVDQLVFCSQHPDKPIELFCEPCKTAICMMCTVTGHKGHDCQTIQATLDKMVPQWEENIKYIDEKIEAVNKSSDEVEKKIEQTRADFQRCVNQIDKKAEERIEEIIAIQKDMKANLRTREKEEIEKLEKVKKNLAGKKRDGENVRRVVRTSLDRARHASLMTELLQEGIEQNMESVKKWEEEKELVKIDVPEIKGCKTEMDESLKDRLLGQVLYSTVSFMMMLGSVFEEHIGSRVWSVDAETYFSKKFKLVKEIKLAKQCLRITPIKDYVWVPLVHNNIQIYNKSCELINTIEIKNPVSVAQASNGDIFIACGEGSGLYITTGIDQTPDLIIAGDFTDVYSYNGKMYSLNYGKNVIQKYICQKDDQLTCPKLKWSLEKSITVKEINQWDTLIVHKSGFYVTARDKKTIYHYNEAGQCLKEFTDSLANPYLCGIDKNSNIMVANSKFISVVQCEKGKSVALKQLKKDDVFYFFDVRLHTDGSIWLLYCNAGSKDCISKYEIDFE